jgi:glucosamine--fructose-6-phosphate aminotransferase (isomerizing)
MCGIIGYVGNKPVTNVLLKGLKRLEYRGYDSSGVAFWRENQIEVHKAQGKIAEVERLVADVDMPALEGGIGHTRWATHGKPNTTNAHPHRVGDIVLVHNGIIENYREIGELVRSRGYEPKSETDSELFGFLVHFEMETGTEFVEAVRKSFLKVSGSASVVAMCERHPGLIVGIRNGSPLVAACDPEVGTMLASDAQPILDYTKDVYFLENGDMVVCRNGEIQFIDLYTGTKINRPLTKLDWGADRLDKHGYPHYMLKEIHEQSRTIRDTLNAYVDISNRKPFDFVEHKGMEILSSADRLSLVACGTSWHASLVGKYWLERWAGLSTDAELASEFRYRRPVVRGRHAVMGVSQSGETADTLAVIQDMKSRGVATATISNVKSSTLAREAMAAFYTLAGPEIGVASTKAFTAQLLMLLLIAGRLGRDTKDPEIASEIAVAYKQLFEMPHYLSLGLQDESPTARAVRAAADATLDSKGFFFLGRGYSYPLALEGALKLKEIAYVHAEGYAAGELKHGPIAMLEPGMTAVVLAPKDMWYEKTVSNLQEVKARSARTIAIGHADDEQLPKMCDLFIPLPVQAHGADGQPVLSEALLPFLLSPILQLFAYEIAVRKGTDVDQPRNLAKSVTVE